MYLKVIFGIIKIIFIRVAKIILIQNSNIYNAIKDFKNDKNNFRRPKIVLNAGE